MPKTVYLLRKISKTFSTLVETNDSFPFQELVGSMEKSERIFRKSTRRSPLLHKVDVDVTSQEKHVDFVKEVYLTG